MIRRDFITVVAATLLAPLKTVSRPEPSITKIQIRTNYELERVFGSLLEDFENPASPESFVDIYYGEKISRFKIDHAEWTQIPLPTPQIGNRRHYCEIEKAVLTDDTLRVFLVGGGLGTFSGLKEIIMEEKNV